MSKLQGLTGTLRSNSKILLRESQRVHDGPQQRLLVAVLRQFVSIVNADLSPLAQGVCMCRPIQMHCPQASSTIRSQNCGYAVAGLIASRNAPLLSILSTNHIGRALFMQLPAKPPTSSSRPTGQLSFSERATSTGSCTQNIALSSTRHLLSIFYCSGRTTVQLMSIEVRKGVRATLKSSTRMQIITRRHPSVLTSCVLQLRIVKVARHAYVSELGLRQGEPALSLLQWPNANEQPLSLRTALLHPRQHMSDLLCLLACVLAYQGAR